jgi:hypothetical protein
MAGVPDMQGERHKEKPMRERTTVLVMTLAASLGGATTVLSYESMYERTPVGEVEVKDIPAMRVMEARSEKSFYEGGNSLFRTLFRYIKKHEVSMTTPVESDFNRGNMRFLVPSKSDADLPDGDGVSLEARPAQTVVSVGLRGPYREALANRGEERLRTWLADHPEYEVAGEAYGVYWNSPFMLGWLKRSEVHIPVVKK